MIRSRFCIGVAGLLMTAVAGAAELEYGFEIGAGTSDNITRVPAGGESETIGTVGVELGLLREGSLVNADVQVDLEYLDYQDNTYEGEVTGMAEANLLLSFVPDRITWALQDSFGQTQIDPFATPTPENRENINYLSTGPDLSVRLGSAGLLTVFGRYSMTDFEDTPLDDQRTTAGVSFRRDLSSRSNFSINVTSERVEFDEPLFGSDYDRQSAFLRYENDGARTRLGIEAGMTELHDLGTTNSNPLLELDVERDLSSRSVLAFRGGVRSSDAATALRAGNAAGGGFPGVPGQVSTSDPFENRHATLEWRFTAQRTGMTLLAGYEEDIYETQSDLDRSRQQFEASVYRDVSPHVRVTVRAAQLSNDFDTVSFDDDELQFGAQLAWNVSGRFHVELSFDDINHESSNPLQEFDETRVFLRLAWRNTGARTGAR